jgi:hypothetical protein
LSKSNEIRCLTLGDEVAFPQDMLRTLSSLHFWFALKHASPVSNIDIKAMAAKASELLSPCMFGHGEMFRTRDKDGHLALECAECGKVKRVLEDEPIKGPQFHAAPVKGAPLTTVRRIKRDRSYPRSA